MVTCAVTRCLRAEKKSDDSAIYRCMPFRWSIGRSSRKLMGTSASSKGSNESSLESSVWMSFCRSNLDWSKKVALQRQRPVFFAYFAVKVHPEELAAIWRSPETSSISTMLTKTLGSCRDYNHQTYQVTEHDTTTKWERSAIRRVRESVQTAPTATNGMCKDYV